MCDYCKCEAELKSDFYCEGLYARDGSAVGRTLCLNVTVRTFPLRCYSVYTYRQHGVRGGSRRLHDPPQRPSHHDHPHLPTLPLLQAYRGACWSGAQGIYRRICF